MKHFHLFVLLIVVLISYSCKKDNPAEPDQTSDTGNKIGVQGGTVKLEDAQINISTGTFSSEQSLTLTKVTVPADFSSNAVSSAYQLANVPISFSKPLEVSVKITGQTSGETLLAVKAPSYIPSKNKFDDQIFLVKGNVVNGLLTASIDNITQTSFGKIVGAKEDGKFVFTFFAVGNHSSYITANNHFRIYYPFGADKTAIINVGQILEDCYSSIDGLGFKLSKRTKWPMDVEIVNNLGNCGEYFTSKRSMNYDFMKIDNSFLTNTVELKATLIHEFFHAAQTMYNPHWNYTSTILGVWKGGYEHLWLDEAVSTWVEAYFLNNDKFIDMNFNANYYKIVDGFYLTKSEPASYGYGMAIFIKYIVDKYGKGALVKIYEKILSGTSSLDAISSICTLNIDLDWYTFIENLFTDKVDPNKFSGRSFIVTYAAKKSMKELKTIEETIPLKLSSISSKIYNFDFPFTIESTKNAQITFSTTDGEICVFKAQSNYSDLKKLQTTVSEITITGLKELIDKKERLIVSLSKGRVPSPQEGTKDITFKYKFEEAIDFSKVKSVSLSVRAAANESVGGTTTPWESYALPKFTPSNNWQGVWIGNKFICSFTSTKFSDSYTNVNGTFTLMYDPIKKEMSEIIYDISYLANGYRNVTNRIVLQNLAYSNYNTQSGAAYAFFEFIKLGDGVSTNIKEFKYTETNTNSGVVTNVSLTGSNSKSQIWIKLNEF